MAPTEPSKAARSDEKSSQFEGHFDSFKGIVIKSKQIHWETNEDFCNVLQTSLHHWKENGIRGVWFRVEIEHSCLVPILAQNDFVFHHAQPSYVMMTRWLPDNEPNQLPGYASNYIGVGGFVLNDNNELLVIKEKYSITKTAHWKLPGGHADPGEDLAETAKREVFEETGIETEFVSLICFRHQHDYRHGQSDMYFVCHLRPLTQELKPCPLEIADCTWMDLDKYMGDTTSVTPMNRYVVECFRQSLVCKSSLQPEMVNTYGSKKNWIYSVHPLNPPQNGLQNNKET